MSSEKQPTGATTPAVRPSGVTAVVLNYRHWPQIRVTLDRLLASELGPDRVVVVDNCPDCLDAERITAAYPGVDVVRTPTNCGYAGGMNAGIRAAGDVDAVLLMTHECHLEPDALSRLESELVDGVGIVGPLLRHEESDEVWGVGGRVRRRRAERTGLGTRVGDWAGRPAFDTDWVDGACLLVRPEALQAVGGLDERFFMYFEEVDLCTRVRAAGWGIRAVPGAVASQAPGLSPIDLFTRNRLLFVEHNFGRRRAVWEVLRVLRETADNLGHDRARVRPMLRGLTLYLRRRWGAV